MGGKDMGSGVRAKKGTWLLVRLVVAAEIRACAREQNGIQGFEHPNQLIGNPVVKSSSVGIDTT